VKEIALDQIATIAAQEGKLLLVFHPLGHNPQVQGVGHGDDRRKNDIVVLLAQPLDEAAADLDSSSTVVF